jgi:hypothetical protein
MQPTSPPSNSVAAVLTTTSSELRLEDLPTEIMCIIFKAFDSLRDVAICTFTCSSWHIILQDNSIKTAYFMRLLSPSFEAKTQEDAIQKLTNMMAKLSLTPPLNCSWIHQLHYWTNRKYIIIVDNSSSMIRTAKPDSPTYWATVVAQATRLVEHLGYLTPEGVYLSTSERDVNQLFKRECIKDSAEAALFLNAQELPSSCYIAESVHTLLDCNTSKSASAVEVIILSDFEYDIRELKNEFAHIKKLQEKKNPRPKAVSFHLMSVLTPENDQYTSLLALPTTKKFHIHKLDLQEPVQEPINSPQ